MDRFISKAKANAAGMMARNIGSSREGTVTVGGAERKDCSYGADGQWRETKSKGGIHFMAAVDGNRTLYTGSTNVRVWAAERGENTHLVHMRSFCSVTSMLVVPSPEEVMWCGHSDGSVSSVRVATHESDGSQVLQAHKTAVTALAVVPATGGSAQQPELWTGSDSGTLRAWPNMGRHGTHSVELELPGRGVGESKDSSRAVRALLRVGSTVWSGGHVGIHLWNVHTKEYISLIPGSEKVTCLRLVFAGGAPRVLSGHSHGRVALWSPAAAQQQGGGGGVVAAAPELWKQLCCSSWSPAHSSPGGGGEKVTCTATTPLPALPGIGSAADHALWVGFGDGTVHGYLASTGARLRAWRAHNSSVTALAPARCGPSVTPGAGGELRLASASSKGTIRGWGTGLYEERRALAWRKRVRAHCMQRHDLDVWVGTYNVNAKRPEGEGAAQGVHQWLNWRTAGGECLPALYVIGMQEVVELTASELLSVSSENVSHWRSLCLRALNDDSGLPPGSSDHSHSHSHSRSGGGGGGGEGRMSAAQAMAAQFAHLGPDGGATAYGPADNAAIAAALASGKASVRLADVPTGGGGGAAAAPMRFEVRFNQPANAYGLGGEATMVQVNLDSGNVRRVVCETPLVHAPPSPSSSASGGGGQQQQAAPSGTYSCISSQQLVGIALMVFARDDIVPHVSELSVAQVKTGIGGIGGNKGGAGVRFRLYATPLHFCCAHLAAHASAAAALERDANYHDICTAIGFPPPQTPVADHELPPVRGMGAAATTLPPTGRPMDYARELSRLRYSVADSPIHGHAGLLGPHAPYAFFLGDLNYRLEGLSWAEVMSVLAQHQQAVENHGEAGARAVLAQLLQHEQLLRSQLRRTAFVEFTEAGKLLSFRPTYKFDSGTSTYDTSDKQRVPAWCDRILYRTEPPQDAADSSAGGGGGGCGENSSSPFPCLRVNGYGSTHSLLISDHKPVQASFTLTLQRVQRDALATLRADFLAREATAAAELRAGASATAASACARLGGFGGGGGNGGGGGGGGVASSSSLQAMMAAAGPKVNVVPVVREGWAFVKGPRGGVHQRRWVVLTQLQLTCLGTPGSNQCLLAFDLPPPPTSGSGGLAATAVAKEASDYGALDCELLVTPAEPGTGVLRMQCTSPGERREWLQALRHGRGGGGGSDSLGPTPAFAGATREPEPESQPAVDMFGNVPFDANGGGGAGHTAVGGTTLSAMINPLQVGGDGAFAPQSSSSRAVAASPPSSSSSSSSDTLGMTPFLPERDESIHTTPATNPLSGGGAVGQLIDLGTPASAAEEERQLEQALAASLLENSASAAAAPPPVVAAEAAAAFGGSGAVDMFGTVPFGEEEETPLARHRQQPQQQRAPAAAAVDMFGAAPFDGSAAAPAPGVPAPAAASAFDF